MFIFKSQVFISILNCEIEDNSNGRLNGLKHSLGTRQPLGQAEKINNRLALHLKQ